MKKIFKQLAFVSALILSLSLPYLAFGQVKTDPLSRLKTVSTGVYADTNETSLAALAGTIIRSVLALLGIIFVVLIIIAGFKWMNAGGNEKDVEDAQKRMKNAVIGLVITIGAYAIYAFVWNIILKA